jgi:TPR repeat protein
LPVVNTFYCHGTMRRVSGLTEHGTMGRNRLRAMNATILAPIGLLALVAFAGCNPSSVKQSGGLALMIERASRGDVEAQFTLGEMYSKERVSFQMEDLQPDCVEAIKWYRRAATNGHPKAPFVLAQWLEQGCAEISPATVQQAAADAKKFAARIGSDMSEENTLNEVMPRKTRRGLARDLREAEYWYRVAAENGNEAIRERTARFFIFSKIDKAEAYYWMLRAIQVQTDSQTSEYNRMMKSDLESQLAPEQIARARQRAQEHLTERKQP